MAARLSIDVVELAKEHRKDISDKFYDGFIELSRLFEGLYKKRAPTEQEMQLRVDPKAYRAMQRATGRDCAGRTKFERELRDKSVGWQGFTRN